MNPNRVWVFSDLLEKNRRVFKIPVYQRNYDWTEAECKKLYEDIIHAAVVDKKHFTGTIVYLTNSYGSSLDEVLVIDGQQRITTIYLLLKALYDIAEENGETGIIPEVKDILFNRNCDEAFKIKLKPIKTDNTQLELLFKEQKDEMDRSSGIYKNYINFKKYIYGSLENGLTLSDILYGIKRLEMVEIVLDKSQGDEPQKIFESINSTGLDLSLADLVRNYLLMDDENQEDLYDRLWIKIEKNVGYVNLGDFVINYLNSVVSRTVSFKNAYSIFKEFCEENNFTHEQALIDLEKKSKYYGAFINEIKPYNARIMKSITQFNSIKQTTIMPFVFKVLNDYETSVISEEILCKVLDYSMTYLVRMTCCENTKNISKFLKSLYARVYKNNDYSNYYEKFVTFINDIRANDRMPTDEEFKDSLLYKPLYKKPICKYLLAKIENSTKEHIVVSNLTIEHILPQKENATSWEKELGDSYKEVYEKYLHTLGNLTITGMNSELGVKSFVEKKKIIQENSKANILNLDVLSAVNWNEKAIINRAKRLANIIISYFKYENYHNQKQFDDTLVYKLSETINVTNSKPESFTFIGEKFKVESWKELVDKFLNMLYEYDSDRLKSLAKENFKIDGATNSYITYDSRLLRKPIEIDNTGIYYESHLSAQSILYFIRGILSNLDIDYDEFEYSIAEGTFDEKNEKTWRESNGIVVGKLFYLFVEQLMNTNQIDEKEIELLFTKEYTKQLFPDTNYPAFARHRDDNQGNSSNFRYRKNPVLYKANPIYVTVEFFETEREQVVSWYKNHLK